MRRFTSLEAFYTSDEWKSLRLQLIHERAVDVEIERDGKKYIERRVYDEHSGQLLLNSFDIIAHHIKPITIANVNDYSISLNPENIMLVSHRSHNEIHARYGYQHMKKVYYVWGCTCSGRSEYVQANKGNSDIVVSMDSIWEMLTGSKEEKPDALKSVAFDIRNSLLDIVAKRMGKWERAWVIDSGINENERKRRIEQLGAEDIFIDRTKAECVERLLQREDITRKEEWLGYIERWYEEYERRQKVLCHGK